MAAIESKSCELPRRIAVMIDTSMHVVIPFLFWLAQPFWEARPPERWTDFEISQIRTDSPWAQSTGAGQGGIVFFATALPVEHAEAELRLRTKKIAQRFPEPDVDY